MDDPAVVDPAFWEVIKEYEARAKREDALMRSLPEGELMGRRDELLLPVGRAAGAFMNMLIKEGQARRILEVGSSYGYSTVWLAEAARALGGRVISLELKSAKTEYATTQLKRAGLAGFVEFHIGDALASLRALPGPFDFVLVDLWKELYVPVFDLLYPKLAPGAIIVGDNMTNPPSALAHARAYRQRIAQAAEMTSVLLTVGNGLEVSRYR